MISIDEIANYDVDVNIFVMPYEIYDLNFRKIIDFNRMKHKAISNSDYEYDQDSEESDMDISLTSYYGMCASYKIIPECFILELIKIMIVDLESMSFASLFSEEFKLFDVKLMSKYLLYFNYLNSRAHNDVARSNISMFVSSIFEDGNRLKGNNTYYDSLLTNDEVIILNKLRDQS